MAGWTSNWEIYRPAKLQADPYAERKRLEKALGRHESFVNGIGSARSVDLGDLAALCNAASKHLDTLPKPKTVFKVTGYAQGKGRKTHTYADPNRAAVEASDWLEAGMEHVAIFRDEVS